MKPGPPRKSLEARILTGNAGRHALRKPGPKLRPGLPSPPKVLSPAAKTLWRRLGKQLVTAGVLTYADAGTFALYCQTGLPSRRYTRSSWACGASSIAWPT
jgi:phage terminase small subunit